MRGLTLVRWLGAAAAAQLVVAAGMTGVGPASPLDRGEPLELQLAGKVGGAGDSGNGKNNGVGNDNKTILASGSIVGLYPGAVLQLDTELVNRNNFDVAVVEIHVAVSDASAACSADNVRVEPFFGSRVVPRNGTAVQALTVRMHNDAPDECKNVSWPLAYSGRAVKP